MRPLILHMMVTLDGYAAGPDGGLDWIEVDDPELDGYLAELLGSVDAQIFGRKSYELLAQYWPQAQENPATPGDAELAALVNGIPKIVVTSRPDTPLDWQPASTIGADLTAETAELKSKPGKPLVLFAGAATAQEFLRRDLVDEIRLLVFPVLLGAGERLFVDDTRQDLRFTESRSFPTSGVILQCYRK
ncbi:dihydrofolate reductase family protein [Nocardia mexicana]|uniref:Dihydrofolate reductase n=1 Tax=Nocardia mexicana TaxID=279262 RepID=A0A370H1W5_9NOCA|nr:dihydrofolate reductase family protein [Nocardia mexicana]RDI50005.1 dihydrofolate reductase [Nocardia mexicana]